MNFVKIYISFLILIISFSCSNDPEKGQKFGDAHLGKNGWTYDPITDDTINITDANNLKQGKWIIFRKETKEAPQT